MRSLCLCAMAASKQSWAGRLFTHRTKAVVKSFAREHLCFHKSSPELLFTSELHCSWVCALKIEGNETQHFLTFWTENTKSALHFLFLIMLIMLFIYCWQKIEARHFNTAQESSAMTFTLTVTAKIQQHFTLIEMWSPTRSGEKEKNKCKSGALHINRSHPLCRCYHICRSCSTNPAAPVFLQARMVLMPPWKGTV